MRFLYLILLVFLSFQGVSWASEEDAKFKECLLGPKISLLRERLKDEKFVRNFSPDHVFGGTEPLVWITQIVSEDLIPYFEIEQLLPKLEPKIKSDLKKMSEHAKTHLLETTVETLEITLKEKTKKTDMRFLGWYVKLFAPEVNSWIIPHAYQMMVARGNISSLIYLVEKNLSEVHAVDIAVYGSYLKEGLAQIGARGDSLTGPTFKALSDKLEKALHVFEASLPEHIAKERMGKMNHDYIRSLVDEVQNARQHEDGSELHSILDRVSFLSKIDDQNVGFFYATAFLKGDESSRQRLLELISSHPHVYDLYEHKLFGQMEIALKMFPRGTKESNTELSQKIGALERFYKDRHTKNLHKRFEESEGVTVEEFRRKQKEREELIREMIIKGGFEPAPRVENHAPFFGEEPISIGDAIEEIDAAWSPKEGSLTPHLAVDLSDQVNHFFRKVGVSDAETHVFLSSAIARGGNATMNAILKNLFGFSLEETSLTVEEVQKMVIGKRLPEGLELVRLHRLPPGKSNRQKILRKKFQNYINEVLIEKTTFEPVYKEIYFNEIYSKKGFDFSHVLNQLHDYFGVISVSGKEKFVFEIILEAIKRGDEKTLKLIASRVGFETNEPLKNQFIYLLQHVLSLGTESTLRKVLDIGK